MKKTRFTSEKTKKGREIFVTTIKETSPKCKKKIYFFFQILLDFTVIFMIKFFFQGSYGIVKLAHNKEDDVQYVSRFFSNSFNAKSL